MPDNRTVKNVRGTKDILPEESYKWQYVEGKIREIFELYNYTEIRTPIFEETELFSRGIGQFTDIVSKEMYTFTDRGGNSLTLKPEMTASVMRAYIQHNLSNRYPLIKVYYISPMFRQERPQAGRLRQFHQFGAEAIGSEHPDIDAEIIALTMHIYRIFEIDNITLKINSVGCEKCRPRYREILRSFLSNVHDKLSPESQRRFSLNPLRILDSKDERDIKLTENAPLIIDHLCDRCAEHFEGLKNYLDLLEIKYQVDGRLVRGLDYYTRTAFEVISSDLGSQDALAGGGRYDLLSEELGGRPTPGTGFAGGMERLLLVLEKRKYKFDVQNKPFVFIASIGKDGKRYAIKLAEKIRSNYISCEIDFLNRSLKAQMREANRQNVKYVIIIGEEEIKNGYCILKDMSSGEQKNIPLGEILEHMKLKHAEEVPSNRTEVRI
jgi:histidyl-tRNA synthetase